MSVSLKKGELVSLAKVARRPLQRLFVGLGWEASRRGWLGWIPQQIDLDASCLAYNDHGELRDVVWFRCLEGAHGAIRHSGDNLTGEGAALADDERITVALDRLQPDVTDLVFVVTSYSGQPFDRVKDAFCRVVDAETQQELARYNLTCTGEHTGMVVARLTRVLGDWQVQALGTPGDGRTYHQLVPTVRQILNLKVASA
ncbi:MAG: Stress protein [Cyanobacteria bacterium RYN_339]|nr:Stress protein [Cyanobacteria bacterium RYN_339]